MTDIRVIEAMYWEYYRIWENVMSTIVYAAKRQTNTSYTFKHIISKAADKIYGSYVAASDAYFEMQEMNPDWEKTMSNFYGESMKTEQSISSLVSEIRVFATLYSERRKFLDMLNIILFTAEYEENLGSFFIPTVIPMKKSMTDFLLDALCMYHEKKAKLAKLGVSLEQYFDNEMLYVIKDMDEHDYAYVNMKEENTSK